MAVRIVTGKIRFSAPLELICDVQFRQEFRKMFPPKFPRHTREHVYRSTASALTRAKNAVKEATSFLRKMTTAQRHKIANQIHELVKLISSWNRVA